MYISFSLVFFYFYKKRVLMTQNSGSLSNQVAVIYIAIFMSDLDSMNLSWFRIYILRHDLALSFLFFLRAQSSDGT